MWIIEWKQPFGYQWLAQIGTYAELELRGLEIAQLEDGAMLGDIGQAGSAATRTEALLAAIACYPGLALPASEVNWSE